MRRSKVREHIFKMLFSIGFDAADADEQIELYLEQVEEASEEERGYMRKKVKDIAAHEEEIDAMINEHTTGWKTGRMNKVDLSVLRLAVYEMKWDDEVPVKVAIKLSWQRIFREMRDRHLSTVYSESLHKNQKSCEMYIL